jgi:hypothetical protein
MNKIFGIGFHKTGTKTLQYSLEALGFNVCGPRQDLLGAVKREKYRAVFRVVNNFDAFQDNPWPVLYEKLDKKFPDSKFILTVRDEDKWIKSIINHFGSVDSNMRRWIYGIGYPLGNEELYLKVYKKHNAEVMEYFSARPNDLLIIDLTAGEGWEKICPFLGKQIPEKDFPHVNKGTT